MDPFKVRKTSKKGPPKLAHEGQSEPSNREIERLVERAMEISEHLSDVKLLYNELDRITIALSRVPDKLGDYGVTVIDNFADKNTQFKIAAISRFSLKWTPRVSVSKRGSK